MLFIFKLRGAISELLWGRLCLTKLFVGSKCSRNYMLSEDRNALCMCRFGAHVLKHVQTQVGRCVK